ncbi:unnamed protein product [Malus baccata var. baccata]
MTSTPSLMATPSPTTIPTIVTIASVEMDHRLVNPASSTSSVALPISAKRTHRRPRTLDQMLPSGSITDASGTRLDVHTWLHY